MSEPISPDKVDHPWAKIAEKWCPDAPLRCISAIEEAIALSAEGRRLEDMPTDAQIKAICEWMAWDYNDRSMRGDASGLYRAILNAGSVASSARERRNLPAFRYCEGAPPLKCTLQGCIENGCSLVRTGDVGLFTPADQIKRARELNAALYESDSPDSRGPTDG